MAFIKGWRVGAFVLTGLFLFFPHDAFAKTWNLGKELKFGPARLRPSFSTELGYNNNINLASTNTTGSVVARNTPGLTLSIPFSNDKLYLEVGTDWCNVAVPNGKGGNPWLNEIRSVGRYNFSELTSVGVSYKYTPLELWGIGTGNKAEINDAGASISHEFSQRLSGNFGVNWQKYLTNIKSGSMSYPNADYNSWKGTISADYKLTPLTDLEVAFAFENKDYKNASSKSYNAPSGGFTVTQKITPRLSANVSGGIVHRDYRSWGSADELTWGAGADAIVSPFSTVHFTYAHGINDTFYPFDPEILKDRFAVDNSIVNNLDVNFRYIITDHVGTNITYRITSQDIIDFGLGYIRSQSNQSTGALSAPIPTSEGLVEHNYYVGAGYSRKLLSWLAIDAKLTYGQRSSTVQPKYSYYSANGGLSINF